MHCKVCVPRVDYHGQATQNSTNRSSPGVHVPVSMQMASLLRHLINPPPCKSFCGHGYNLRCSREYRRVYQMSIVTRCNSKAAYDGGALHLMMMMPFTLNSASQPNQQESIRDIGRFFPFPCSAILFVCSRPKK